MPPEAWEPVPRTLLRGGSRRGVSPRRGCRLGPGRSRSLVVRELSFCVALLRTQSRLVENDFEKTVACWPVCCGALVTTLLSVDS